MNVTTQLDEINILAREVLTKMGPTFTLQELEMIFDLSKKTESKLCMLLLTYGGYVSHSKPHVQMPVRITQNPNERVQNITNYILHLQREKQACLGRKNSPCLTRLFVTGIDQHIKYMQDIQKQIIDTTE